MVFKDQSVPSGPKNRPTITAEGVGECMEGQIGGKSGPGVFRTRQSGLESALGRVLVGTKNLGPPPRGVSGVVFPAPPLARLLINSKP